MGEGGRVDGGFEWVGCFSFSVVFWALSRTGVVCCFWVWEGEVLLRRSSVVMVFGFWNR